MSVRLIPEIRSDIANDLGREGRSVQVNHLNERAAMFLRQFGLESETHEVADGAEVVDMVVAAIRQSENGYHIQPCYSGRLVSVTHYETGIKRPISEGHVLEIKDETFTSYFLHSQPVR